MGYSLMDEIIVMLCKHSCLSLKHLYILKNSDKANYTFVII